MRLSGAPQATSGCAKRATHPVVASVIFAALETFRYAICLAGGRKQRARRSAVTHGRNRDHRRLKKRLQFTVRYAITRMCHCHRLVYALGDAAVDVTYSQPGVLQRLEIFRLEVADYLDAKIMAPYVSPKHGMIGLTRTAAIDLAPLDNRVKAMCPNRVTTTMGKAKSEYFSSLRGMEPEAYRAQTADRVPLGRVGRPEDTASAVAFLAPDDAAFITEEALNVSGGEETF